MFLYVRRLYIFILKDKYITGGTVCRNIFIWNIFVLEKVL